MAKQWIAILGSIDASRTDLGLKNLDQAGLFLLGGGQSSFAAGIIATTWCTPIIALEGFGGAAARVWGLLNPFECPSLTEEAKSAMAEVNANSGWASRMVKVLGDQKNYLANAAREQDLRRKHRLQRLRVQALTGVGALALVRQHMGRSTGSDAVAGRPDRRARTRRSGCLNDPQPVGTGRGGG